MKYQVYRTSKPFLQSVNSPDCLEPNKVIDRILFEGTLDECFINICAANGDRTVSEVYRDGMRIRLIES